MVRLSLFGREGSGTHVFKSLVRAQSNVLVVEWWGSPCFFQNNNHSIVRFWRVPPLFEPTQWNVHAATLQGESRTNSMSEVLFTSWSSTSKYLEINRMLKSRHCKSYWWFTSAGTWRELRVCMLNCSLGWKTYVKTGLKAGNLLQNFWGL